MPKARWKHCPDRAKARSTSFLETKCFVCLDSPHKHPSRPLLCCREYIHEECLLECLRFANQAVGDSCPHCRAPIQAYHVLSPNVPLGPNPFCFRKVHYLPPPATATRSGWMVRVFWHPSGAGWWSLSPVRSSSRPAWLGRIYEPVLTIYTPWVTSLFTVNQRNSHSYLACWRFPSSF